MTKILVDEVPAGPALDAAVARARHGEDIVIDLNYGLMATSEEQLRDSLASGWIGLNSTLKDEPPTFCLHLPKWSTDIVAAWGLVDLVLEYAHDFELEWRGTKEGWFCYITELAKARTVPLAITRAYLKARGVEHIEMSK